MNIDKDVIIELLKQRKSQEEIALFFNLSVGKLSRKLSELNLNLKELKTEINKELVLKLKEQGLNNTQISKETGFSRGTVAKYLYVPTDSLELKESSIIENIKELVLSGKTNFEISCILNISKETVRKYIKGLGLSPNFSKKPSLDYNNPILTESQLDLIYGSSLGDLCIELSAKNARITIHQGGGQEDYFDHKCKILETILSNNIHKEPRYDKRLKKYLPSYHAKTLTHPQITEIYNIIYSNKIKTVTKEWLSHITLRGLAYWFMDDGCNSGSLYTMGFSLEENELLQEWLLNTYNIKTSIHKYKGYSKENSSKLIPGTKECYYSLYIKAESRKLFKDLISPYIIPSMEYKLQMS